MDLRNCENAAVAVAVAVAVAESKNAMTGNVEQM
jgi:hypothetical protein